MADRTLRLPKPFPLQREVLTHPARFQLLEWGRRTSKTRTMFLAALTGHGPGWPDHPQWPGVLHGWDVAWIARDMPQAKGIWEEEIVPRCEGVPGFTVNHTDHFVRIAGAGTLHLRTAENITSVRGIGARLKGLCIDEAAHFDLGGAWKRVLRPALVDNQGWAIIGSTTNAGYDGNAEGVTPSHFNTLCTMAEAGNLDLEWAYWHADASQNPHIDPTEFQKLVAAYPPDSPELAQEVYARRITQGGGLLFGYLNDLWHRANADGPVRPRTRRIVSADWGWTSPAPALWIETSEGVDAVGKIIAPWSRVYREWWPTETIPPRWAEQVIAFSQGEDVDTVVIDAAIQARGQDGSPSIYEQMEPTFRAAKIRLVPVAKGPSSLQNGTQLLHTYFWTDGGTVPPLLSVSPQCPRLWAELRALRRGDPSTRVSENPNVPAPGQSDHGFDALRYWAASRPVPAEVTREERQQRLMLASLDADATALYQAHEARAKAAVAARKPEPVRELPPPSKRGRSPGLTPWRR